MTLTWRVGQQGRRETAQTQQQNIPRDLRQRDAATVTLTARVKPGRWRLGLLGFAGYPYTDPIREYDGLKGFATAWGDGS
jgi:hypothetical protein